MEDNNYSGLLLAIFIGIAILAACGLLAGLMVMLGVLII